MRRTTASGSGWPAKRSWGGIPTHAVPWAEIPSGLSLVDMARLWRWSFWSPAHLYGRT